MFKDEQTEMCYAIESLLKKYEEFTKKVSPKCWRATGSHFTELRNMQQDILEFTPITPAEKKFAKKFDKEI